MLFSGITGIATAGIYLLLSIFVIRKLPDHYVGQLRGINRLIILVGLLFLLIVHNEYPDEGRWIIYLGIFVWIAIAVFFLIRDRQNMNANRDEDRVSDRLKKWIKNHVLLIILLAVVFVLSLDADMYQFKWDGLLYYLATKEASLSSVSSVALYGHIAMSSGAIYRLFASLFGNVGYGMICANIAMLMIGICAFYGCIKTVCPGRMQWEYILGTSCFAFSPFLLGMVNYMSTDWFSVCMAPVLIYCVLKKQWIWTVVAGCVFCMTKEPSLIAYTGLCFGLVVYDLIAAGNLKDGFLKLFRTVHYYFMLIPYFLWMATYKILGPWSAGNGGFGIDFEYIVEKFKVFCVLNYNWLIIVVIIVGIVKTIIKGRTGKVLSWIMPLLFSNIFLLMFNFMFVTINHARYIDSFISVNILILVLLLMTGTEAESVFSARNRYVYVIFFAIINVLSCLRVIDPISELMFKGNNVGNMLLLSTGAFDFGDSAVYNKQMLWMERPIDEAISDCINDGSAIVMALSDDSVYSFDGMSEQVGATEDIVFDIQYWDAIKGKRVSYADESKDTAMQIEVFHVNDGIPVESIYENPDGNTVSVIYIKGVNDYVISDDSRLISSKDYSYRGWTISRDTYDL